MFLFLIIKIIYWYGLWLCLALCLETANLSKNKLKNMKKNIINWVCVDAQKIGTWKQAEALAKSWLGGNFHKKPINLSTWCRWMPPKLFIILPKFLQMLAVKGLKQPLPDLVIAAGRQAVLVAIALRHKAKTVVLMNPGVPSYYFDVVIAPVHDQLVGKNVIATQGALHSIEPSHLVFPEHLRGYPGLKIGVLLGGNSIHGKYENSLAVDFANDLKKFCTNAGSLIITPSRRTPVDWLEVFEKNLNGASYWIWDQKTENPYPGLLSGVDAIVVCEDSISMASEACVMGKPVFIYQTGIKKAKFKHFYQELFDKGYAQPFSIDATLSKNKDFKILKEVDRVVEQIRKTVI